MSHYRIQLYKYNCGGLIGNLTFAWKLPEIIDQTRQFSTTKRVAGMIPKYEQRACAKDFREKYANIASITPVFRRSLVQYLTGKIPEYVYSSSLFLSISVVFCLICFVLFFCFFHFSKDG